MGPSMVADCWGVLVPASPWWAGSCPGEGGGIKAEEVCRLVLPGVCTGLGVQEEIVCIACPKPWGKGILTQ